MTGETTLEAGTGPARAEPRDILWQALIDCDETRAIAVVRDAVAASDPTPRAAERVLLELIAPAQERVGAACAADTISVAQEHAATAINDRCVSAVAGAVPPFPAGRERGRVTVACVDGEWHALPARLLAEVLRLRGWAVDHLGARVPTEHLITYLHQRAGDAVLLSSSIPSRLPAAHRAISACRTTGTPVMAGGAAFGPDGRYARRMRAVWVPDAIGADALLAQGLERPAVEVARLPDLDLPHLSDQEYTLVGRTKRRLVKQTLADVEEAFLPMRRYSAPQRERTAEDIDHIVTYLITALYVDDAELFTTFVAWTAGIHDARGVPPRPLLPALDSLLRRLTDFPRATGILAEARQTLTAPGPGRPA